MDKYFVYCSENGYESFETEEEAIKEAERRIDEERDAADDGWDENVETITYGKITHASFKTGERSVMEEDMVSKDCEFICDYKMMII